MVTGYWFLVTGYWVLGTGYWVLGTGFKFRVPSSSRIQFGSTLNGFWFTRSHYPSLNPARETFCSQSSQNGYSFSVFSSIIIKYPATSIISLSLSVSPSPSSLILNSRSTGVLCQKSEVKCMMSNVCAGIHSFLLFSFDI